MPTEKKEYEIPTSAKVAAITLGVGVLGVAAHLADKIYTSSNSERLRKFEQRKKLEKSGELETNFEGAVLRLLAGTYLVPYKLDDLMDKVDVWKREVVNSVDSNLLNFAHGARKGSDRLLGEARGFIQRGFTKRIEL